jgi:hypothetical protein
MGKQHRPYTCSVTTCPYHQRGFTSKGDLKRHTESVHQSGAYYCPQQGCSRSTSSSTNKPFARTDHLRDHMKRIHNRVDRQAVSDVRVDAGSSTLVMGERASSSNRQELGTPPHQLRTTTPSTRKRRRLESISASESADSTTCGHEEELDELNRKVADLERRLKISKDGEAKLAELVSHYRKQID